ncbi:hypothetical protein PG993_014942 [Apiospora rasikravindrae]|uniref:Rhodopsin domain-containing protein n=1 Tax=Apiospora rasikravindrae TaxID=990691 RepID=A0ABR1RP70_9PEZI
MSSLRPVPDAVQSVTLAMAILLSLLPTSAVALRIWARRISGQRLQWSDGLILLGNATLLAYWSVVILTVFATGVEKDSEYDKITVPEFWQLCRGLAAIELLFGAAVYLLKFSTLALLRELFSNTTRPARIVISALTYLSVVCATASITGTLYIALPADPNIEWTNDLYYKDSVNGFFNFSADVVLDFAIFLIPIWQLFHLRLDSRKKRGIMLAFGLGFL